MVTENRRKEMDRNLDRVASILAADFNARIREGATQASLPLLADIAEENTPSGGMRCYYKGKGERIEVPLATTPYSCLACNYSELQDFAQDLYSRVLKKLHAPKRAILWPEVNEYSRGSWYSTTTYRVAKSINCVVPCREFADLNRRLERAGQPQIDVKGWWSATVFGKRESYNITDRRYLATSVKKCAAVLEALKGRRKFRVELKRNECLENRNYGIEYETEWDGSIFYELRVKDADGKTVATV